MLTSHAVDDDRHELMPGGEHTQRHTHFGNNYAIVSMATYWAVVYQSKGGLFIKALEWGKRELVVRVIRALALASR